MSRDPDYDAAARALAIHSDDESISPNRHSSSGRRSASPIWTRRSVDSASASQHRPRSASSKWIHAARRVPRNFVRVWSRTPVHQRIIGSMLAVTALTFITLAVLFRHDVINFWIWAAKRWRKLPAGWLIIWLLTFVVSFPPLIGYSMIVSLAAMVYGMKAWFIVASASILGSTASFVVSRTVLRDFVGGLTAKSKKFQALCLVLKHDGFLLLCLIRVCPLPYSIANGVISTIPTVTWPNFMLATTIASPKLLLHIFVGSQIGNIAENGDKMDRKTQIISYIGTAIGIIVVTGTGYVTLARTQARAKVLEAEEAAAAGLNGSRTLSASGYADDDDPEAVLRGDDDISLHPTHEDSALEAGYGRRFTDDSDLSHDEDATERDDIFDVGDEDDDDEGGPNPR